MIRSLLGMDTSPNEARQQTRLNRAAELGWLGLYPLGSRNTILRHKNGSQ